MNAEINSLSGSGRRPAAHSPLVAERRAAAAADAAWRPAVLVTGASSGIGLACTLDLAQAGFHVFAGVRSLVGADALRSAVAATFGDAPTDAVTIVHLDVTRDDTIRAAVKQVSRACGARGLAGLVNNAGIAVAGPLEFLPLNDFREQLNVNVTGQLAVTQAFLPLMRRPGVGPDRRSGLDRRTVSAAPPVAPAAPDAAPAARRAASAVRGAASGARDTVAKPQDPATVSQEVPPAPQDSARADSPWGAWSERRAGRDRRDPASQEVRRRTPPGRIVNIGSVSGLVALPFMGPYSASKYALEAVSDSLRLELAPWGIRVALVEPGSVATPIWQKAGAAADEMVRGFPRTARRLYGPAIESVRQQAMAAGAGGIPPEQVVSAVRHALSAKRPRTRYLVAPPSRARTTRLLRLLPTTLRDRLIARRLQGR